MGLAMTVATVTLLLKMGHDANSASIHFTRAIGAAAIALSVMAFLARNSGPSKARTALIVGFCIFFFLEAVVDFRAILTGTYGLEAWFTGVIPWLIFLVLTIIAARSDALENS